MVVQQLAPLILSDDERAELTSLTMRRKTAQALAVTARIVLKWLTSPIEPPLRVQLRQAVQVGFSSGLVFSGSINS